MYDVFFCCCSRPTERGKSRKNIFDNFSLFLFFLLLSIFLWLNKVYMCSFFTKRKKKWSRNSFCRRWLFVKMNCVFDIYVCLNGTSEQYRNKLSGSCKTNALTYLDCGIRISFSIISVVSLFILSLKCFFFRRFSDFQFIHILICVSVGPFHFFSSLGSMWLFDNVTTFGYFWK